MSLVYTIDGFKELIEETFKKELDQNNIDVRVLTLNSRDTVILLNVSKGDKYKNCIVKDTFIEYIPSYHEDEPHCVRVYEDNIEDLFTKIKKTIFDICLIK